MTAKPGRPRRSSPRVLEEAAEELFLELGYEKTTIDHITQRAGVSRTTFFNYFSAKSDLFWIDADSALDDLRDELETGAALGPALRAVADRVADAPVALAVTQSEVMGAREEFLASGLGRVARLSSLVTPRVGGEGFDRQVAAQALTGVIVAAWRAWASDRSQRRPLAERIDEALAILGAGIDVAS